MRYSLFFSFLLSAAGLSASPAAAQQKIYLATQLKELLRKSSTDSLLSLERNAAREFHRLINNYRRENKADTLCWNDTLWMTSRNHSTWMYYHDELTHSEEQGTELFSGKSPGDRYSYVTGGNPYYSWSGENALYNWTGGGDFGMEHAREIAEESFEQWKHSPGHNKNMLNPASKVHGVAFIVDTKSGRTWATDLFTYGRSGSFFFADNSKKKEATSAVTVADKTEKAKPAAAKKPSPEKIRLQLLDQLYGQQKPLADPVFAEAAAKHARYMAANKSGGHEQLKGKQNFSGADPRHRVIAAASGFDKLNYRRQKVKESVAVIEVKMDQYDAGNMAGSIRDLWKQENETGDSASRIGIGIEVKRVKDLLKIYAVRLEN